MRPGAYGSRGLTICGLGSCTGAHNTTKRSPQVAPGGTGCGVPWGRGRRRHWAPLTRKRHIMPHSAQPQHTNYWALRTRKRHQQEQQPQRPTERSDPTQHAKGRAVQGPVKEQQPDGMSHGGGGGGAVQRYTEEGGGGGGHQPQPQQAKYRAPHTHRQSNAHRHHGRAGSNDPPHSAAGSTGDCLGAEQLTTVRGPPPPPASRSDTVCVLRFNQVWHRE